MLNTDSQFVPPDGFNFASLQCIPKKPSFSDETLGDVYEAGDTRPLSIVNADNRILATALKHCMTRAANEWVSRYFNVASFLVGICCRMSWTSTSTPCG